MSKKRTNSIRSKRRTTNKTKRIISSVIGKTVKSRYIKTGGEPGDMTFSSKEEAKTGTKEVQYSGNLEKVKYNVGKKNQEKELPSGKGVFTIIKNNDTVEIIDSENIKSEVRGTQYHFSGNGTVTSYLKGYIDERKEEKKNQTFNIVYSPISEYFTILIKPTKSPSLRRIIAQYLGNEKEYDKQKIEKKIKKQEYYNKKKDEEVEYGVSRSIFDV